MFAKEESIKGKSGFLTASGQGDIFKTIEILPQSTLNLNLSIYITENRCHKHVHAHSPLTSSLVVWLREIRYVWKPVSPTTDHSVKKHTNTSTTVDKTVKEN